MQLARIPIKMLLLFTAAIALTGTSRSQSDSLLYKFEKAKQDLRALKNIVAELNRIDSAYLPSFPLWVVNDPNIALRVYASFRNRGKHVSEEEPIYVIADPDSHSIDDIKVGDADYGRVEIQTLMARDLRQDILADALTKEPPEGLKRPRNEDTNPIARPASPDWLSVNLSLFESSLLWSNRWGVVVRLGEDELGYPFWSAGQFRVLGAYKSIKLGAWLPLVGGIDYEASAATANPVFTGTSRLLNGSDGLAGEFEFEWDAVRISSPLIPYAAVGGMFEFGGLSGRRPEYLTYPSDSLYYLSTVAQGYYAFDLLFDSLRQNINVHLGASYSKVSIGKANFAVQPSVIQQNGEPRSFVDPLIRIEYRNYRFDRFRIAAQYSRLLLLDAWAEIIPPFLYVELKYSSVVFRDPNPWEHRNYIFGTLGVKFEF